VAAAPRPAATELAAWAAGLTFDAIPAEVVERAKLHLLDAFGTGLAARARGQLAGVVATARELGGPAEATVIGGATAGSEGGASGRRGGSAGRQLGAGPAALANGALIHALDFDDTHEVTLVHSSAVVAPSALAVAEANDATGAELLAAAIAGYEISSRVGLAAPGRLHVRGFHPTSVCGVFAAAALAAKLRGLDADGIANALGIAGSQAGGLMEYLADGSQTKPLHAGWAAFSGIVAAALAANGGSGPATVLEGRFGLLASHAGEFDAAALTADLGSRWETTRIAIKPYPVCHATHTALDAVAELAPDPDSIESITALVAGDVAVGLVLEPAAAKAVPRTTYDAKFSLPYCIGALLTRGELGLDAFTDEAIADPRSLALAAKVTYEVVPFEDGNDLSGGVRIRTAGRESEAIVLRPRGGPAAPLTAAEVEAKFRANAIPALGEDGADRLIEIVGALERHPAADLAAALGGARHVSAA
jgi:2-methylcitrate dehydratase PrpD